MCGIKTFRLLGGVNGVGTVWCGVALWNTLHIGLLCQRRSAVEQPPCKRKVRGSNPLAGSTYWWHSAPTICTL